MITLYVIITLLLTVLSCIWNIIKECKENTCNSSYTYGSSNDCRISCNCCCICNSIDVHGHNSRSTKASKDKACKKITKQIYNYLCFNTTNSILDININTSPEFRNISHQIYHDTVIYLSHPRGFT